ncbi:nucleotide-binding protein, putative [Entamoeba dispar SAW760]|uniref:Nucleotide-binding protein, putative n=1 Tax=Entamoeba dispar (strain ATCC PRA-260 / SAW760) TaxID=370354 RepID=B0EPW6_ENTDS|nr:nucleotide-binding protein, putative [Entamoeba dispar SAW760]EDR23435.1 nucleotide-binding protein, putative [Entamoeba dispar SAW760]|eukprot:EDR23435.1 nucleotide-binding protein, putative [Entamoeba dispar SAW760]
MTELNADRNFVGVDHVKNVILVLSGKGGVGKSTIATALARSFALVGKKTGILDIDLCGPSVPKMMGLDNQGVYQGEHGGILPAKSQIGDTFIDTLSVGFMLSSPDAPVIWRGPKKGAAIEQFLNDVEWGDKDVLVVDTPPGTSDEHITIMDFFRKRNQETKAVIVTTPQLVATNDVEKEIDFCHECQIPIIGLVENMSGYLCPHCSTVTNIFSSNGGKELADKYQLKFVGAIPIEPKICLAGETGVNPFADEPSANALKPITDFVANLAKTFA